MMRRIGTKVRVCERCLTYKRRITGCEKEKNMKRRDKARLEESDKHEMQRRNKRKKKGERKIFID